MKKSKTDLLNPEEGEGDIAVGETAKGGGRERNTWPGQ